MINVALSAVSVHFNIIFIYILYSQTNVCCYTYIGI